MDISSVKQVLRAMPFDNPIILRSNYGAGKSLMLRQAASEQGIGFFDIRLSQLDFHHIYGEKTFDPTSGIITTLKPHWWPRDPNSSGILFFDELNRASKEVLRVVYQVCLHRRLDGERLPDGWRVVAGVSPIDNYEIVEFDYVALLDRSYVIDFNPTL